jgi:deoxyadenosine/deoxycytidine kinase
MTKKLFFVEANIGACKTTLIQGLKGRGYTVYEEPVELWKERYCEKDGTNILGKFYEDMSRWSFDFEVMTFVTRKKQLLDAISDPSSVIIIERSLYTDRRTFALNLYQTGLITEMQWKIYDDFFWSMMKEVKRYFDLADCYYLYINTAPSTCWERLTKRNRKEEESMIPTYITQLHEVLESWLFYSESEFPVLVVDGHFSESEVLSQAVRLIESI